MHKQKMHSVYNHFRCYVFERQIKWLNKPLQHTRYNLFAHSSCTSLVILIFIKSTVDCIAHFSSLHILLILFLLFYFFYLFLPMFKYMLLCYVSSFIFLHCPLSGPVLTYISLLIIPCMIVYMTISKNLEP